MRKHILSLLFCLAGTAAFAQSPQNSNSMSFTVVALPPGPTITSLGGLSPTGKIYAGSVMQIIGSNFTSSCAAQVDGTTQPASSFTYKSSTEIDYTIPASLSAAAHTMVISCPLPALTMNTPVTLPNAIARQSYSADLASLAKLTGGIPPYKFSLTGGSLPTGLALSSNGIVTGTPSGAGSFSFGFTVTDSSQLSSLRRFRIFLPV
jgi:hypothetical protein